MNSSQARSTQRDDARLCEIRERLITAVAERTRLRRAEIRVDEPIHRYGIDSLERVNLAFELERWLGLVVDESTLFDLETIDQVAGYLAGIESAGKR